MVEQRAIGAVVDASSHSRIPGIGTCIYCDDRLRAKEERLSDEHIVPESLGGKLILENASCRSCATQTSRVERLIARDMLDTFRAQFGVKSKRKAKQSQREARIFAKIGGNWREIYIPLRDFPIVIQMPILEEPRLMARNVFDRQVHQFAPFGYGSPDDITALRESLGATRLEVPVASIHIRAFGYTLLKIAHAFTVSMREHTSSFSMVVPRVIFKSDVRDFPEDHLVGGYYKALDHLTKRHNLALETVQANGRTFLTVVIRLFGDHEFPAYRVVTGVKGASEKERLFRN